MTRLTHERIGVLFSDAPAYKEFLYVGNNYTKSRFYNAIRVQSIEYQFINQSKDVKAIGEDKFITRGLQSPVVRSPDVSFSMDYLFAEGKNEISSNLYIGKNYSLFRNFFNLEEKDDVNIFVVASNSDKHKDIADITKEEDFNGYTIVGIGNAFLTNWNYSAKIGSLPSAKMQFLGSTINFSEYNSNSISRPKFPSVKLGVSDTPSQERLILSSQYMAALGHDSQNTGVVFDEFLVPEISAVAPGDVKVNIDKISGSQGGTKLDSVHAAVQSVSIDVNVERQSIYGLGSNYVFDRKLQLPITGKLSMSLILREFDKSGIDSFFGESNVYKVVVENRVGLRVLGYQGQDYVIDGFYYVAVFDNTWRRVPFDRELLETVGNPGQWFVGSEGNYFYICAGGYEWGKIPLTESNHDPSIYPGYNPDYEAYVNSYEDLLYHYENIVYPNNFGLISKAEWGAGHWEQHGRYENRILPGVENIPNFYYESEFVHVWTGTLFKKFSVAEVDLTTKEIQNTLNVSQGMNFDISRAQLKSQSHQYKINQNTMVDVEFSFDISEEDGLRLYFQ